MFINSELLKNRIQLVANEISLKSDGKITFQEYISLPHYGYSILRFRLNEENYTTADLDRYEAMMYDCAKDEFLVNFMGKVYQNVGVNYRQMDRLLSGCLDWYSNEERHTAEYAPKLQDDARELLALCGLSTDLPVWEVQMDDTIQLLVLGDKNEELGRFCNNGLTIDVYRVATAPCEGLMTAVFYAKRNRISLASALLQVQASFA